MRPVDVSIVKWRKPLLVPLAVRPGRGQLNCLTMLLTPADGSFRLELMDIDVKFLLLLMLDGIKPWPISGRAAVAVGNEDVRAKTTTNKMVAMAADVEVAESNTFNRGMKTVSSSTCESKKKRKSKRGKG